jgi:UDP-2,3-diacylglucosamine hydrolase
MKYTIFISDTHLGNIEDGNIAQVIINCLKLYENELDSLYLLGDIFNVWVGDEQKSQPEIQNFLNYIISLSAKNIKVFIMHGNRDFLMGEDLCKHLNAKLLQDPYLIDINNKKVLLTHGDLLCTDDKPYQRLRKIVHNKIIQNLFLALAYKLRYGIAIYMRKLSMRKHLKNIQQNTKHKYKQEYKYKDKELDINLNELEAWYQTHKFDTVIHGHTHKTALYAYDNYNRMVLSDWHEDGGTYAIFDGNNIYLKKYSI